MNRFPTVCNVMARRFMTTGPPTLRPLNPQVKLLDFRVPFPPEIEDTFSLATANQQEITQHKIMLAVQLYKKHNSDTGSAIVQLAVMTEKIYNLARHFAMHKKDKAGQRGFQVITFFLCRDCSHYLKLLTTALIFCYFFS